MEYLDVADQVSLRVYITPEKRSKFKAVCALKGTDMSQVCNELIDKWLAENALLAEQPSQEQQ